MITSYLILDNKSLDEALTVLLSLPERLKPIFFTHTGKKSSRNKIMGANFEEFKKKHKLGFTLYGEYFSYNIDLTGCDTVEITLFLEREIEPSTMVNYMEVFSEIGMYFGFVCDEAEYEYRNRIDREIKGNHIQCWVGRDIQSYVSGIYWLTFISKKLIEKLNIDIGAIAQKASFFSESKTGDLIQFYELPCNWEIHRKELDALCNDVPGIFSKKDALEELKSIDDVTQFFDVIHRFR